MIKLILSYLLHHANRETKLEEYYRIKDKILSRYGKPVGFDVQFIEGKICHSCGGRGVHDFYDYNGRIYKTEACWHCYFGWYKRPSWVLLQRLQFGKYIFHKPIGRGYGKTNPFANHAGVNNEVIKGYIDHERTKFGKDALVILYLLYDWKGYWKRWKQSIGRGWYCHKSVWWNPRKWPNQVAHIIRYGKEAIPFQRKRSVSAPQQPATQTEDSPF